MKELTHNGTCKEEHPDISHEKWEITQIEKEETDEEQELDELVGYDGALLSSKIPLGINKANKISNSTTDDVAKTAHQKGNGFGYYYRRYWGEAYELGGLGREHPSEVSPEDDIDLMTADETIDHFEDKHGLSALKAATKAKANGKNVEGSEEEFHSEKQRIVEISEQKMRDMLEIILKKKDNDIDLVPGQEIDLHDEDIPVNPIRDRMANNFKSACEADGVNPEDILKMLKDA